MSVTTPAQPDVTAPTVQVTYPTQGATVSRTIYFRGTAKDLKGSTYEVPSGIAGVQFLVDGVNAGPVLTVPYSGSTYRLQFDTRTLPNGPHVLAVRASDQAGNTATSAGITFTVSNK